MVSLCLLFFSGCGRGRSKTDDIKEVGDTPMDIEKEKVMREIQRDYEESEPHYKLGQLYQSEGLWAQAQHEYDVAISFNPAHRGAQAATIYVCQMMGDKTKADMTADTYITQTSGSAKESLKLALAFQKEKLDDLALRSYMQALRLAPNSAKINRQIGYYYLSKGDKVLAKQYLHASFSLNPNQPQVAGELGRLGVDVTGSRGKSPSQLDKIVSDKDRELR
jgi:tetratricopeptide (TPR) repeat protein